MCRVFNRRDNVARPKRELSKAEKEYAAELKKIKSRYRALTKRGYIDTKKKISDEYGSLYIKRPKRITSKNRIYIHYDHRYTLQIYISRDTTKIFHRMMRIWMT